MKTRWLLVAAAGLPLLAGALVGFDAPDTAQGAREACLAEAGGGTVQSTTYGDGRAAVVLVDQEGRTLTCRAELVGDEWSVRLAAVAR